MAGCGLERAADADGRPVLRTVVPPPRGPEDGTKFTGRNSLCGHHLPVLPNIFGELLASGESPRGVLAGSGTGEYGLIPVQWNRLGPREKRLLSIRRRSDESVITRDVRRRLREDGADELLDSVVEDGYAVPGVGDPNAAERGAEAGRGDEQLLERDGTNTER